MEVSSLTKFTVAILAGGRSTRMGTDKALVALNEKSLIEHVIARVSDLGQGETILITNQPGVYAHLGLPMFGDVVRDKGSLGGIYTAITYSQNPYTLALACDLPFVKPDLLRYMLSRLTASGGPFDVIVPRAKGLWQGLHAIYGKACLAPIRECLDTDDLHVIRFYPKVRVCYLSEAECAPFDPDGLSFFNVNTREDLEQARRMAAGEAYSPTTRDS
jgi:molybdopterin-guanine dinucleotide biosynthesis protein A